MISVAFVQHHVLLRTAMVSLLEDDGLFKVAIQASSGKELIARLETAERQPEICIIGDDVNGRGYGTIQYLKSKWPYLKAVALAASKSPLALLFVIQQGADGYINIDCEPTLLKETVYEIYQGCISFPPELIYKLNELIKKGKRNRCLPLFSGNESLVIELCLSHTNKEMAQILAVKNSTINSYLKRIYCKLSIRSKQDLLTLLYDAGFERGALAKG